MRDRGELVSREGSGEIIDSRAGEYAIAMGKWRAEAAPMLRVLLMGEKRLREFSEHRFRVKWTRKRHERAGIPLTMQTPIIAEQLAADQQAHVDLWASRAIQEGRMLRQVYHDSTAGMSRPPSLEHWALNNQLTIAELVKDGWLKPLPPSPEKLGQQPQRPAVSMDERDRRAEAAAGWMVDR